ncbi:regulator of MON1-CCZ1 complex-like [Oppia nitens]|uniref:regulator of MON1-CCZ1 complex-like n=1 Tax=Oppia nitens TaxID=1686743 RepID=UPI0023D98409|nr:regulator of MON1-CCZ1 complex-like [Oppia nitens]
MSSSSSSPSSAASASNSRSDRLLELSAKYVRFESVSKSVNVFYDEANQHVFVVNNRCADGVIVDSVDQTIAKFKLEDRGDVLSIKFSPATDVLAIQRSANTVEFINFANGQPSDHYSQPSRSKNGKVLGFVWTNTYEMVYITDNSIELYQVVPEKRIVKCLKTFAITVSWFVYESQSAVLLVANGTFANAIQVFQFKPNTVFKLTKFEVDWSGGKQQKTTKTGLYERDVAVTNIYGKNRLLVLKHHPVTKEQSGAHIVIYTFAKDLEPQKTDILMLNLTGRFAINIVDDLVIVHHQTSQTSLVFDINLPSNETIGNIKVNYPIFSNCTIKAFKLDDNIDCELYSTNWVIFQPNIIIDAKLGCLWFLQINLKHMIDLLPNIQILIDFLIYRRNSKSCLLRVIKRFINPNPNSEDSPQNQLGNLSVVFNKLNAAYRETLTSEMTTTTTSSTTTTHTNPNHVLDTNKLKARSIIEQKDVFSEVFSVFDEQNIGLDQNMIISILFEYIYSLSTNQIQIQYFVYEVLIRHLVRSEQYYQMHQFLQYHVFTDSKPLACLLLSLEPHYKFAVQLALDMLKRLTTANEEIIEVLLSQYQISRALRFIQSHGNIDSISARKFLEIATNSGDNKLFYSVYKFFELRNLRLRGSPAFANGEHCETYIEHFSKLFGSTSSLPVH